MELCEKESESLIVVCLVCGSHICTQCSEEPTHSVNHRSSVCFETESACGVVVESHDSESRCLTQPEPEAGERGREPHQMCVRCATYMTVMRYHAIQLDFPEG